MRRLGWAGPQTRPGIALAAGAVVLYLVTGPILVGTDAHVALADAFLHGRLHIVQALPTLELVPRPEGGWYSPFPPAPALTLLPFVAIFGLGFDEAFASAFVGGLNVLLFWLLLERIGVGLDPRRWLTVAFAVGSVHWWVAGMGGTHHYAEVVAVLFSLIALRLAVDRRWPFIGGLSLAAAAASRLPVGLTLPLYLALYAGLSFAPRLAMPARQQLRSAGLFLLGVALPAIIIAAYNVLRFGSPLEFGYAMIPSGSGTVLDEPWYRSGLLSLEYIPRHLYAIFLRSFDFVDQFPWFRPNWYGTSLLLTTPIFLWLVKARAREPLIAYGWLAVGLGLLPDITHGTVGFTQFGYRFSLDVAPVLWLMLGWLFRNGISVEGRLAIVIGVLVNVYGIVAITLLNFVSF